MGKATITFRDQANGRISDFLRDEGLNCAQTLGLLSYLTGALVSYKEEGVELNPSVLVCDDIGKILSSIPGAIRYSIGSHELVPEAGSRILKECGVLATGNWLVFIERREAGYEFGVVSFPATPLSISLRDAISISDSAFALVVRKSSQNTVEIYGARGSELSLVFSTVRDTPAESPTDSLGKFCNAICSGLVQDEVGSEYVRFMLRLLTRTLDESHGTILICLKEGNCGAVPQIRDYIGLDPHLDFFSAFAEYRSSPSAEAIVKLQNFEALLSGLIKSDGIVMFSDSGAVVGYRAFFRPDDSTAVAAKVVGGARRRAFEGVCSCIGEVVMSGLFRSQDGLTLYKGGGV